MSGRRRPPPRLTPPGGWLDCPAMGEAIIADRFVALKTPLNDTFDGKPHDKKFSLRSMQSSARLKFGREIGLIVDLTNTDKYYRRGEVKDAAGYNCGYVKLSCQGHDLAPSSDQTDEFIRVVMRFIERGTDQLVGVHCTHGFNRTGYMICSYLVKEAQMDVETAITTFKAA